MRHGVAAALVLLGLGAALPATAQQPDDADAVRRAALDYVDGFYDGDTSKLHRSVRPEVVKYGFYREDAGAAYEGVPMSFQEMLDFAERVRTSGRHPPATAPKIVTLLDVQDQTATAKVVAWWGTDYLQLARYDGRWMILHVLWQSPPR